MTNVYLEKIAAMVSLEDGVYNDPDREWEFHVTDAARRRIAISQLQPHFQSQKSDGAKVFGVIGAGLGGLIGTSPLMASSWKGRVLNSVIGAGIGYGLGAVSGIGLASAGNVQTLDSESATEGPVKSYLYRNHVAGDYWPSIIRKED
jgi:hypothetical protein